MRSMAGASRSETPVRCTGSLQEPREQEDRKILQRLQWYLSGTHRPFQQYPRL